MNIDEIIGEGQPEIWRKDVSRFSYNHGKKLKIEATKSPPASLSLLEKYLNRVTAARIFEHTGNVKKNPGKLKEAAMTYMYAARNALSLGQPDESLRCDVMAYILFRRVAKESERPYKKLESWMNSVYSEIMFLCRKYFTEQLGLNLKEIIKK